MNFKGGNATNLPPFTERKGKSQKTFGFEHCVK